jgi:hypothetical protein
MFTKSWFGFARSLMPTLLVGSLALAPAQAAAAMTVVTPGEQNTQSGENGCNVGATCGNGHWLHYPEILQNMLGANYVVTNNGDGGAVLGCDAATMAVAGNNSFCMNAQLGKTLTPTPDIVIIGPFGEHDQRIVGANGNVTTLYKQSVFEGAYEGLVQKYLMKGVTKIYMMTPIDMAWGGTPNLPAGDDLAKNVMLPASIKVACDHHLPIIDTYTAISATTTLATMYTAGDGQVTSAGQQKMASLLIAAIMSTATTGSELCTGGTGGTGGAGGGGGAGGAGGAGTAGAGGAGGATGGAGGSTAGAAGAGGAAGTTPGTAGAGGSTSTSGAAGSTTGSAGVSGGTAGTSGTAGTGAGTTGAAGAQGTAGTGTSTVPPRQGSSGGCATAAPSPTGGLGLAALAMLAAVIVGRRRSRRR